MKIKYINIVTKDDQQVKINEAYSLCIGFTTSARDICFSNDAFIVVSSLAGEMRFKLSELLELDFCIADEESNKILPIFSDVLKNWNEKEEEDETK